MTHFTPFGWLTLALFTGVLAAVGQVIAKGAGQAGVPPYALIGIVGGVWFTCSVVFMALGSAMGERVGLPPILSLKGAMALGSGFLLAVVLAGAIFWVENLARFDAINKAPIALVLLGVELSAAITALTLEYVLSWHRGQPITMSWQEVGGFVLAAASLTMFAMAPPRT